MNNTEFVHTKVETDWRALTDKVNSLLGKSYHFTYIREVVRGHKNSPKLRKYIEENLLVNNAA